MFVSAAAVPVTSEGVSDTEGKHLVLGTEIGSEGVAFVSWESCPEPAVVGSGFETAGLPGGAAGTWAAAAAASWGGPACGPSGSEAAGGYEGSEGHTGQWSQA